MENSLNQAYFVHRKTCYMNPYWLDVSSKFHHYGKMIALVENKHTSIKVNSLHIALNSNITWIFFSSHIFLLYFIHFVQWSPVKSFHLRGWKQHVSLSSFCNDMLTLWYVKWVHIFISKTNCVKKVTTKWDWQGNH